MTIYNSMFMKKMKFKVWQVRYFTCAKNPMASKVHCLMNEILQLKMFRCSDLYIAPCH